MAELDRLEDDHRRCEVCHGLVDQLARQWLETGRIEEGQRRRLHAALDDLTAIYAAHIQVEEERVFQVASQALGPAQVRAIGAEMRERRSLRRA
jgi:hypothetical protein